MNPNLEQLHPYPFEKLTALKSGITPPEHLAHIALSIGEPKHAPPEFVKQVLIDSLDRLAVYPMTKGLPELRETIAQWLTRRFNLNNIDADTQVLPVNGTREALFAFAQAVIDPSPQALVLSPNPFYQIYEGAALLAGAQPYFLNCTEETGFAPDFDAVSADIWDKCQLIYLCSPGNPTGAVLSTETLQKLIRLADKHDFIIASDECYSEIYRDEESPPTGLLQACAEMQRHGCERNSYERCVVFHSLSKRSNLPGLRSGFVAGDATILKSFLRYRTYHGCAMPVPTQLASISAWEDEQHVKDNRDQYREKFQIFQKILGGALPLEMPEAGFYFWANTSPANKGSEEDFARELFAQQNITVLPGPYLSRDSCSRDSCSRDSGSKNSNGINPGENRVRMALVAPIDECREAAERIVQFINS